ncbi:unnamed protein product [Lactuca virosa]|uniref:ATP-dependent DNA helicase n=1 Tax=Lactuca virosa TaxID=75947 RepID=A0AAU9NYP8_9ASTR|nr:unnamed protein product [Lactuca virosa]
MSHRLQWKNLDKPIVEILTHVLATNPYVATFRRLADLGPLDNYRVTLNASIELDQRVYNRPTTSEVAGIWVEGNDNITAYKRSIIVYGRSEKPSTIQSYWACYDPLSYPLFFPNGEPGWHYKIPRQGVSINEIVNDTEIIEEDLEETDGRTGRKTEQLFKRHVLGEVGAYVYVIEFQKRGLPHAHFLLIMTPEWKLTNADHYDKYVCAEIPNPTKYPILHDLVKSHMIHGPCGTLNEKCSCMQGDPPTCRFRYPRQFNETTTQGKDAYPVYRRRDTGIAVKKQGIMMDNRWVVPYNPKLLMMFNCLLNVEVCSSITSVKYVFKYIYKGHDKQVIHIDPDAQPVLINEIKRFQDARYVSAPEATWRIFSFALSQIHPNVITLQLHLPNQQLVRFSDADTMTSIVEKEKDKRSMLTAFFKMNKENLCARKYLYNDFPKHFTWSTQSRLWNPRKQAPAVGRLVYANPAEGERYYLRVLLCHIRGPTCFEDLYTVNDVRHPIFRKAALEKGRLFATILVFCDPGDVRKLWNSHYNALSEDYRRQYDNVERVQNMVLTDINIFLQSMSNKLENFDLPAINTDLNLQSGVFREVQEECSIVVEPDHLHAQDFLNPEQKYAYDEIMKHVCTDCPGVFFIDGPGGTGKTYLYKALLANIRKLGHIALATASSGVAANNMLGGRTAHSRLKIPLNPKNNSFCNIQKQSGTAELLRLAKIIIWDEASMIKRQPVEAVDQTMQDITGVALPFGGKIMVMGGDFRQVLPVVRRGTCAQIVDSSLRMSPLWPSIIKLRLTINMRALTDPWFSNFLLRVGDGVEETVDGSFIRIPDDMVIPYTDKKNHWML